jgi:hypothetical protein
MATETEVQKRIVKILDDAARSDGSEYAMATCKGQIEQLLQEGLITADHRDMLLFRVGNLLVKRTPEAVRNYLTNSEFAQSTGALTGVDQLELGLVLLRLVGQRLVTVEEAIALQAQVVGAALATPPAKPVATIARTGPRAAS